MQYNICQRLHVLFMNMNVKEIKMLKGYVHSLESFGSVDGPGVRYVIFLSGCAMRCQFCHNPDTWNMTDGKEYTTDQLLKTALRFKSYWGDKGGITVSGGEPLLQMDFLTELFRKAKEAGVHTTLDTSGNPYTTKNPSGIINPLLRWRFHALQRIRNPQLFPFKNARRILGAI